MRHSGYSDPGRNPETRAKPALLSSTSDMGTCSCQKHTLRSIAGGDVAQRFCRATGGELLTSISGHHPTAYGLRECLQSHLVEPLGAEQMDDFAKLFDARAEPCEFLDRHGVVLGIARLDISILQLPKQPTVVTSF